MVKIENFGNCSLGMGEFLDLIYDYIVWNFYVLVVVCLVNFIIKIIIMNNNSFVFFF